MTKNKPRVLLIGKGGKNEGVGHLVRLSSLIDEFYTFFDISVLTNQDKLRSILLTKTVALSYSFNDYRGLLKFFGEDRKYALIIVDILNIPLNILKEIKKYCNFLIIFDDLKKIIPWDKNLIVIHPQEVFKGSIIKSGENILLEGADFFPLRQQFRRYRKLRNFRVAVRNIIVVLGGLPSSEDILSLSKLLDTLLDKKINLHIILGYASHKMKKLAFSSRVKFYQKVDNLAYLIFKMDLGIISGGFIKFEFMCIGIPFALISVNRHQELLAREFSSKGYGIYLGRLKDLSRNSQGLLNNLGYLFSSTKLRRDMFLRSRRLVDGKGCIRILRMVNKLIAGGNI